MVPLMLSAYMALIVLSVVILGVAMLYGITPYLGLKFNAVTVLNLKCALGLAVEFCAHFARSFMLAGGNSRPARAAWAVQEVGVAVVNGAITTFLGIVMIAASKWPYFRAYFFVQYAVIQAIVLFNGLFVLPLVLSRIGPAPFDRQRWVEAGY